MTTAFRMASAITAVGLGVAVAATFVPAPPFRGWAYLLGFGLVSVPWLFGMFPDPLRRRQLAMGAYMLAAAAQFSRPYLWPGPPKVLQSVTFVAFMGTVGWLLTETVLSFRAAGLSESAGISGAVRPPRVRVFIIVAALLGLVLPWLFWLR